MNPGTQSQSTVPTDSAQELNIFQRVMLMWEEIHSYNAAHALRIEGRADRERLQDAIDQTCRARGIGDVMVDPSERILIWSPPSAIKCEGVDDPPGQGDSLARLLAEGLNTPFKHGPSSPFRWSILEEPRGDGHLVVLVYRHVVADGRSIERFLGEVMRRYTMPAANQDAGPAREVSRVPANLPTAWGGRVRGFLRSAWLTQRIRRGFSFPERETVDNSIHVVLRSAEPGLAAGIAAACRRFGIGVTDLFLAALASAIVESPAYRSLGDNAPGFGLGTVVSDRSAHPVNGVRQLGVRLHNLVVMINRPRSGFDNVLRDIAAQTSWYKMRPRAVETVSTIRIRWAKHVWPRLGIRNERASYRKYFPICAGVSPVRVDADRFGPAAPAVGRYIRAVPTGPTAPVVVAPTIFGDRLEFSLTAMKACLTPAQSEALLDGMLSHIETFASVKGKL